MKSNLLKCAIGALGAYALFAATCWTINTVQSINSEDQAIKEAINESLHTQDGKDQLYEQYLLLKLDEMAKSEPTEELEKLVVEYARNNNLTDKTLSRLIGKVIDLAPSKMRYQFPELMRAIPIVSHTSTDSVVRTFTWYLGPNGYGTKVFIKGERFVSEIDFVKTHLADKKFGGDIYFKEVVVKPIQQDSLTNYEFEIHYAPELTELAKKKIYREIYTINNGDLVRIDS